MRADSKWSDGRSLDTPDLGIFKWVQMGALQIGWATIISHKDLVFCVGCGKVQMPTCQLIWSLVWGQLNWWGAGWVTWEGGACQGMDCHWHWSCESKVEINALFSHKTFLTERQRRMDNIWGTCDVMWIPMSYCWIVYTEIWLCWELLSTSPMWSE